MSKLEIVEHKSTSYAPRTYHNASMADITIALAVDYETAGEKLTHKAAGDNYVKLPLSTDYLQLARHLYGHMRQIDARIINVAGNGIYTLNKHGWTQIQVNRVVYDILNLVNNFWKIDKIVSGGQTGVDIAGGVAAYKLGIDCEMTLPKGFKQRYFNGKDYEHTEEYLQELVRRYAAIL